MPYKLDLPDGSHYTVPDNIPRDVAEDRVRQLHPELYEPPEPTFGSAFKRGLASLGSQFETLGQTVTQGGDEAARQALIRERDLTEKYGEPSDFSRVSKAYNEEGVLPAAKELLKQSALSLTENIPTLGEIAGATRLGAMAGTAVEPGLGTVVGGGLGALAGAFMPRLAGNIEQQAAVQKEAGKPIDVDVGKAAEYAAPMAGLDVAAQYLPLGKTAISKIFGKEVSGLLEQGAVDDAERVAKDKLTSERGFFNTAGRGIATNLVEQVPIQVAQKVLSRAQTGQDLFSDDALQDYGQGIYTAALLSPMGVVGSLAERSEARDRVEADRNKASSIIQETPLPPAPESQESMLALPPPPEQPLALPPPEITGRFYVDTEGNVYPETRSDLFKAEQIRQEREDLRQEREDLGVDNVTRVPYLDENGNIVPPSLALPPPETLTTPAIEAPKPGGGFIVNEDGDVIPRTQTDVYQAERARQEQTDLEQERQNLGMGEAEKIKQRMLENQPDISQEELEKQLNAQYEPAVDETQPDISQEELEKQLNAQYEPAVDETQRKKDLYSKNLNDIILTISQLEAVGHYTKDEADDLRMRLAEKQLTPNRSVKDLSDIRSEVSKDYKDYIKSNEKKEGYDETKESDSEKNDRYAELRPDRDIQYSQNLSDNSTGSSNIQEVQNQIKKEFGIHGTHLLNSGKVEVVQDVASLPPREDGSAHPETTRGAVIGDKAYIVAGNIGADEVRSVMLHEVGAHLGMERLMSSDQYNRILDDFDERTKRGEAPFVEARQNAEAAVDADDPDRETSVRRESLAYLIEKRPDLPFIKRLLSQIKVKLNDWFGGRLFNLNADDLRTAAIASLRKVSSAEEAARPDSFYKEKNLGISYSKTIPEQSEEKLKDFGSAPLKFPEFNNSLKERAMNAISSIPSMLSKAVLGTKSLHEIAQWYGDRFPVLHEINKLMNQIGSNLVSRKKTIDDNINKWRNAIQKGNFTKKQLNDFNDIALRSTLYQVELLKDRGADQNMTIVKQFNALPKALQDIYEGLRNEYDKNSKEFLKYVTQDLSPSEAERIRAQFESSQLKIYLPLFRRGEYWLTYQDADNNTVTTAFKSARQRAQAIEKAKSDGAKNIRAYSKIDDLRRNSPPPTGFLSDVMTALAKKGVTDEGVLNSIYESYLDYFPAESLRQRQRHRANILGMEPDIIHAYANVGNSMANALNKLQFAKPIDEQMGKFKQAFASNPTELNKHIYDTVNSQVSFFRNPEYNNLSSKLGYFGYLWDIAGNASSALVSMTHMPMVMYPLLGAKYGFNRAAGALLGAGTKFKIRYSPELDVNTIVPEKYKDLYHAAHEQGALGYHVGADMYAIRNMGVADYSSLKRTVDNGINATMQTADKFNREISLMAAYELALKDKDLTHDSATKEQKLAAQQEAINHTKDAYGSALTTLGPSIMHNGFARAALMFKRFALLRMNLLAKAFNVAFRDPTAHLDFDIKQMRAEGRSEEEIKQYKAQVENYRQNLPAIRAVARRQLLGFYGLAFAFAGVSGMPLVGAGKMLASLLFNDKDKPYDPDEEALKAMGPTVWKGILNGMINAEVSSRTGWNDMFWKDDPKRMAEVGAFNFLMERSMGPLYSAATQMTDGYKQFMQGNYERGLEAMMPVAIRNGMKAMRYATEGAKTSNGEKLVDNVNAYNAVLQGLGFAPADVAEARARTTAMSNMQKEIMNRRTILIDQAYAAHKNNDYDTLRDVNESIRNFNKVNPGVPINGATLQSSYQNREKKEQAAIHGFTPSAKLRQELLEEYPEEI